MSSGETPEKPREKETDKEEEETTAESEESQTETADTGILAILAITVVWIRVEKPRVFSGKKQPGAKIRFNRVLYIFFQ